MQSQTSLIDLSSLLRQGVTLQNDRVALLRSGLAKGLQFFEEYNESRIKLAFAYFDQPMREALFEILFLLHTNTPAVAGLIAPAVKAHGDGSAGNGKPDGPQNLSLYIEGAPAGVAGIERLSPVFRNEFQAYVRKTFGGAPISPPARGAPIVTMQAIGSIGTIGHKSVSSDLDLQVIYNLNPITVDAGAWSTRTVTETLQKEAAWWKRRLPQMERMDPERVQSPEAQQQLQARAVALVAKNYPLLFGGLISRERDLLVALNSSEAPVLRPKVIQELVTMIKRSSVMEAEDRVRKEEALLKARAARIEAYVSKKFPGAEVHLFTFPIVGFRLGRYSSTLESKESSGSAYELLLNYETLMPGIHITPMVPAHFLFPVQINNNAALYSQLMDYIHFDVVDVYREVKDRLVDLGHTPDIQVGYVAEHNGAMYWEAFKASSGNLPKATLNLLRYEMLLEPRLLKTNIQLIKDPTVIDKFAAPKDAESEQQLQRLKQDQVGLPAWAILEIESAYPFLRQDPWWLRYKSLKIGFAEDQGVAGLERSERDQLSRVVDLAFALHVRISDVLTKPGDTRKFNSPRERVLVSYLQQAFPPGSARRTMLEQIFIGEVQSVNRFEQEMRSVFKRSMNRVGNKISRIQTKEVPRRKEFELWFQYYVNNFEPAANMVQRTIMNHLQVPRGRLQVGYLPNEGWYFRSLQRETSIGKRFDTFGVLDALPDEVMLLEKCTFLGGLAHCMINGYYGVIDSGTLKERRTALEFDGRHMDQGHNIHNTMAHMRPDMVERIMMQVQAFFGPVPYIYTDVISKPKRYTELLIFLGLWHFGRLSFLYRDNLDTWYVDEYEQPALVQQAQALSHDLNGLMHSKALHSSIASFFNRKAITLEQVKLRTWVNPNSVVTPHSATQLGTKERVLAEAFEKAVRKYHQVGGPYYKMAPA